MSALRDLVAYMLVVAAFTVSGYFVGVGRTQHEYQVKLDNQNRALVKLEQNLQKSSDHIVTKYVDRVQTITKEAPVYVASPSDCQSLPYSFMQFINSAAGIPMSETAGIVDGSTITVATVATTTGNNLRACRIQSERLISLQEWANSVSQ